MKCEERRTNGCSERQISGGGFRARKSGGVQREVVADFCVILHDLADQSSRGPILAGVPAMLIAWTQGQTLAVFALYFVLQMADGYIFTPLVQQRTVSLAPALTILAQVLFGVLAGSLGLLLATPLTAAALVLVRRLYLEDVLGDHGDAAHTESPPRG